MSHYERLPRSQFSATTFGVDPKTGERLVGLDLDGTRRMLSVDQAESLARALLHHVARARAGDTPDGYDDDETPDDLQQPGDPLPEEIRA